MDNKQFMCSQQPIQVQQSMQQAQGNQMVGNGTVNVGRVQQYNTQVRDIRANVQETARREVTQAMPPVQTVQNAVTYHLSDLNCLDNIGNMGPNAIEHIFLGGINAREEVVGYHYEGIEERKRSVVDKSTPDASGVYTGKVQVQVKGIIKSKGSSFFPATMSPQQVIDKINEAFANKTPVKENLFMGTTTDGILIEMRIDANKIATAYPVSEETQQQLRQGGPQPNQRQGGPQPNQRQGGPQPTRHQGAPHQNQRQGRRRS